MTNWCWIVLHARNQYMMVPKHMILALGFMYDRHFGQKKLFFFFFYSPVNARKYISLSLSSSHNKLDVPQSRAAFIIFPPIINMYSIG
jgi:hypothetical protein